MKMIRINNEDHEFFFKLLDKDKKNILSTTTAIVQDGNVIINDEDIEADLYDWLNDWLIEKRLDENYKPDNIGKRLEKISDHIYSEIET